MTLNKKIKLSWISEDKIEVLCERFWESYFVSEMDNKTCVVLYFPINAVKIAINAEMYAICNYMFEYWETSSSKPFQKDINLWKQRFEPPVLKIF